MKVKIQTILEGTSLLLLVAICAFVVFSWNTMPDKIPCHYNAAGMVDRWGSKSEILILPAASILIYIVFPSVSGNSSLWKLPAFTQSENQVYSSDRFILSAIKLELILIFSYLTYCSVKVQPLGRWFLPITIFIIFGTVLTKKTIKRS